MYIIVTIKSVQMLHSTTLHLEVIQHLLTQLLIGFAISFGDALKLHLTQVWYVFAQGNVNSDVWEFAEEGASLHLKVSRR